MSKLTMYFDTMQQLNDYFPSGVPSTVLAIVKEQNVLVTTSNNETIGGPTEDQGGYIDSPTTVKELSDATEKSEDILSE